MGATDGAVIAFRRLVDNGPASLRYNIVLVSDGYTAGEIPLFRAQCASFLRKLFWTPPFSSLRCTLNVYALEVSSTQSGIDDPAVCGDGTAGSGAMPSTFFDSTMCAGGQVRRVVSADSGLVRNRVAGFLPQANSILVLVNSALHGGAAGDVAVFTAEPGWEDTALHEFGHVLGLADEYACYTCDGTDDGRTYSVLGSLLQLYGLADEPNITDTSGRAGLKWGGMVAAATPVPTPPGSVPAGTVGLFEGAKYYALGLFRSEEMCKMKAVEAPFCAVCGAAIISALAPWTPTTTCAPPVAQPPSLTVRTRIGRKLLFAPGQGGYEVALTTTSNLPGSPTWSHGVDGGTLTDGPADRTVIVPINEQASAYVYTHSISAEAQVTIADLEYWVPATSAFTTAHAAVPVALAQPNIAANAITTDFEDPGNTEGTVSTSLNLGGIRAGNGWIHIGTRRYFTRLAVELQLDGGYFGPADDPGWAPQSIDWEPAPNQSAGVRAFYDVHFDKRGLCWLDGNPASVVDPNVGFPVAVVGNDAIGQSFSATGRLVPTSMEYRRSVSTIEIPKIPQWEWPVLFDTRETIVDVVLGGVQVKLEGDVLQIGDGSRSRYRTRADRDRRRAGVCRPEHLVDLDSTAWTSSSTAGPRPERRTPTTGPRSTRSTGRTWMDSPRA